MQLVADASNRPLVMVRFNPDGYTRADGTEVVTCWGRSPDKGLCRVKPRKANKWNVRLATLNREISAQVAAAREAATSADGLRAVTLVRLYFDETKVACAS